MLAAELVSEKSAHLVTAIHAFLRGLNRALNKCNCSHYKFKPYTLRGNMEIRRIKYSDLGGFVALWDGVFKEGQYLSSPPPPAGGIGPVLQKVEAHKIPQFVAIVENELVASAEAFPGDMCGLKDKNSAQIGVVGAHVKQSLRGQGIGRTLLKMLIADSKRYGYSSLILEVYESNKPAKKLYESLGFIYNGFGRDVVFPSGLKVRSERMSLLLGKHCQLGR
ncbi:MAG: GNAT superfamily N-acetyltransferase [Psychromonas sp.]|jgi:GNAT superfamily N-acetyltransferase